MSRSDHFEHGASEHQWVHHAEWFHGTSVPGLTEIDARQAPARYPGMGKYYSVNNHNFATTDRATAEDYAREAADMDAKKGLEGRRPVVYRVQPTSEYFDTDPNSGPHGWGDGPSMEEAAEHHEYGIPVSMRFHDPMKVIEAHDVEEKRR